MKHMHYCPSLLSTALIILISAEADLHYVIKSRKHDAQDCLRRCGEIDIPYPFGIGKPHCYLNDNFAITCNYSTSSKTPFLTKYNLQLLKVQLGSLGYAESAIVRVPSATACQSNLTSSYKLKVSGFYFDYDQNVFASVGCDGYAYLYNETGGLEAGCTSVCPHAQSVTLTGIFNKSQCNGYECCQANIPMLTSYNIIVGVVNSSRRCRSGFLISKKYLEANAEMLASMTTVPVVLSWHLPGPEGWKIRRMFLIIVLPVAFSLFISAGGFWLCWRRSTKKFREEIKLRKKYFKGRLEEQSSNQEELEKTKIFAKKEMDKATDNFNEDRVIGKGGQGTVYKGMLTDGKIIAVKKPRAFDERQSKEFINEVILFSQINHRNVVKLLGCCLDTKVPLLVYEFIQNGTLSDHLHNSTKMFQLDWRMRLRIAAEVAAAIAYLHSASSSPIYHRDIKSSNILLDEKFRAKLCDFGISRSIEMDKTHLTTCVKGTFGYLDPEYFRSGHLSEKSDVYSFGVVLFELVTGRKPICETSLDSATSVVTHFINLASDSALSDMMDQIIFKDVAKAEVMAVANLAKRCLKPRGVERPTMIEVAMELERLRRKSPAEVLAKSM